MMREGSRIYPGNRIYLHPNEDTPNPPRAQSKRFFIKIMLLLAVAMPWLLSNRVWFDGMIGIWPVIETVQAKSSNMDCAAGATVSRPVNMDREKYRDMINDVMPVIKVRIARDPARSILIQQDGTGP
ncbi:unnamed protein product, partial [Discosporangium mesarthrocarpum]